MPIVSEKQLIDLLRTQTISALTIDTNIFDEKRHQFNAAPLSTIATLKGRKFDFLLSRTVAREVVSHLTKNADEALREARKSIGKALYAFEVAVPTRNDLLDQISGKKTSEVVANERFDRYVYNTECEIIEDADLVSTRDLFDGYFAGKPPFGTGKKKEEFPDALALHALEAKAISRNTSFLVVSKDGDWEKYCNTSKNLYLLKEIETALALLNDPPIIVQQLLSSWLAESGEGRDIIHDELVDFIGNSDFNIEGYATAGDLEIYPYEVALEHVEWAQDADIDIIETVIPDESGGSTATVSMPLRLDLRLIVELSFSVWDSIDKESISMGTRTMEIARSYDVRAVVEVSMNDLSSELRTIDFVSCDVDLNIINIDMGEVEMFDSDDF